MECPICRLINPPDSSRCDCGYDFATGTGGRPRRADVRLRAILSSAWLTWLIVTAGDYITYFGSEERNNWNYVPNAVFNLFTPIFLGNFTAEGSSPAVIFAILFTGLLLGDWLGRKIKHTSAKIAYNLLILVLITAAIDMIVWGSPKSIERIQGLVASWRSPREVPLQPPR